MKCPCSSAKGMGSINEVRDVAILLGLMLKYVCDYCDFRIFSSPKTDKCHLSIDILEGSILDNMKKVIEIAENSLGGGTDFPFDYLDDLIEKKTENWSISYY